MALKEDYKDATFSGLRKYKNVDNGDGTVSMVDVTEYAEAGDKFGAKDVNAMTKMINNTGDDFNEEQDYVAGDYAVHDNKVWKFTSPHPAGPWDESHVEPSNILKELAEQNKKLTELSEKLQDTLRWKRLAEVVGKTEITLPKSFSELLIVAHNATKSYVYTINVPHDCLTEETNVYFRNGIGNQGGRDYVSYNINLSRILLASMFAANSDSTTSATTIVYYR